MGLSQSKLGELVGRSPSTIRSWERDDSTPNDPDVLMALAAVLGVDQRILFDKAGVDRPDMEESPTLEQELATLRPPSTEDAEDPEETVHISFTYHDLENLGDEEEHEGDETSAAPARTPRIELVPGPVEEGDRVPVGSSVRAVESPSFTDPVQPFVVTRLDQVYTEPSYVEDPSDRQLYRVRNVGTAVGVVVMLLLLMYAAGKGLEAFGAWWDSFFGQLRL